MAPRPTCERPPSGLNSYWTHTWDHALKTLQAQGTWAWEQKPLLDEYVAALKAAEDCREGFRWLDALERYAEDADELPEIAWQTLAKIAAGLPTQWGRHVKRAVMLAEKLVLSPAAQRAHGIGAEEAGDDDGFAALDRDELAPRRKSA